MNLLFAFICYAGASTCNWEDIIEVTCSQKEMKISLRENAITKCPLTDGNEYHAYITSNNIDLCKVGSWDLSSSAPPESGNLLDEEHLSCIDIDDTDQEVLQIKTNLIVIGSLEHSIPVSCQIGIFD